ncbi:MAG: hypothetical protein GF363_16580, partial [Chitinivibrionales bacterium]|nr:hypothetical protein [Chitinivibrionales bacterium]
MKESQKCRENLVLILAPTGRDASVLLEMLSGAELPSRTCYSIEEFCAEIHEG